ncbi:hypothetical protein YC2023_050574 [Brassica napus]
MGLLSPRSDGVHLGYQLTNSCILEPPRARSLKHIVSFNLRMRSERNGSSGKQSCSSGRVRSCGGWMQRKRHGGGRSCGSGGEEVAVAAVKELRQWQ